jgi:hypothetical protein
MINDFLNGRKGPDKAEGHCLAESMVDVPVIVHLAF